MNYQVNQQEIASVVINGTDVTTTASDVITIPGNTVVTGIVYEEVVKCDASVAITLKAKTAHAESGSFVGFTTGATDAASGYNAATASGAFFTKAGDTLTVAGASALTTGKLRIGLVGFKTGMSETITSAGDNKAPVDPYTPPEKA